MWWILYTYLALVAVSGRSTFFFFTVKLPKAVKNVRDNIKASGYTPSVISPEKITKNKLIFFALFAGPVLGPATLTIVALYTFFLNILPALYLIYRVLDTALYILILSPFGWELWSPGHIWGRKSKKLKNGKVLPWYYYCFSFFTNADAFDSTCTSWKKVFATTPKGKNHTEYLDKLMVGILSEFEGAKVWGHQGGFIILTNDYRIVMKPSKDRLKADFETKSYKALDSLTDSFKLTVKKVQAGL